MRPVGAVGAGSRPDCHDMSLWCHVTSHSRRHAHTRAADCGVTGASGLQIPTRHGDHTDNRQGQCGVLCLNTENRSITSPQCSGCPCVEAARLVTSSRWFPGDSVGNIVLSPRQEQVAGGWSQEGSGMLRIIVSSDVGAHRTPPHTAIISMDPGTLRLPR